MYKNAAQLIKICKERNSEIYEVALEKEINLTGKTESEIWNRLKLY